MFHLIVQFDIVLKQNYYIINTDECELSSHEILSLS